MPNSVCFNVIHACTFNQQRSGTQKSSTHILGSHSESEAEKTRRRKKSREPYGPSDSRAQSPSWTRVSLSAGTHRIKALFSPAPPCCSSSCLSHDTAHNKIPPSHPNKYRSNCSQKQQMCSPTTFKNRLVKSWLPQQAEQHTYM